MYTDKDRKTREQKFSGMKLKICPTDYHTWGFPVFVIEPPSQGGTAGLLKWEPRERNRVYLGKYPFHSRSVSLVLKTRTGHVYPQYHV